MKKFLVPGLMALFPLLNSCNYEDDFLNKNPEIEEVVYYNFTLTVTSTLGNPIEGALMELFDSSKELVTEKTTNADGQVANELEAGEDYTYAVTFDGVTGTGNVELLSQDGEETIILEIEEENSLVQNSPIIITGLASDPRGSDGPAEGASSTYDGGNIVVTHNGGYEYIQLMALTDINFAENPYSVVTASNGTVGQNGWAEGGSRTLKFNLTEGEVKQGEFFYVGGSSKVISGYGSCGKSTDISGAKWIRAIDYKTNGGDGLGDPIGGILGNLGKDGSNTPDGVAVFEGINVTSTSVPLDAVFYGTEIGVAYDAENQWGYRVPERNDHYSSVDPETGEEQPFFGEGTNTFLFAQPASDIGEFSKLGGATSSSQWYTVRTTTIVQLSYCPGESTLSDIEESEGVTNFQQD